MTDSLSSNNMLDGERSISRREFVKVAGAMGAGGTLWALSNHSVLSTLATQRLPAALVRSTFLRHLGETFQVQLESAGALSVRLVEVRDLRSGDARGAKAQASKHKENCFSILFHGPGDRLLEQRTYYFEHRELGEFPLFIVPVGPLTDEAYYEAIFNRLAL